MTPVSAPHAANRIFCFDSLQENNTLQKLVLIQCGIGDVGVAALAESLKVGFQFIHRRCILKIATHMLAHTFGAFRPRLAPAANHAFSIDFLQVNKHLTSLNMSGNKQITDKGWAEFAKGLAISIRALFHPMAPKMSSRNRYQHAF